jgi:hypothetical protein
METAKPLFSYRPYWAKRFGVAPFLPMSRKEMEALGWDSCDVILVTGDAYIDHPSFGMALIGRLLEAQGFRVGIISQPDWKSADPFRVLGRPNLYFGVTAGNMDSMVNRYTSDRKIRSDDAYTPNAEPHKRPGPGLDRLRPALPGGLQGRERGDRRHRSQPAPHRPLRLLVRHGAPLGAAGFQGRHAAVRQRRTGPGRVDPSAGGGGAHRIHPRSARHGLHGAPRLEAFRRQRKPVARAGFPGHGYPGAGGQASGSWLCLRDFLPPFPKGVRGGFRQPWSNRKRRKSPPTPLFQRGE